MAQNQRGFFNTSFSLVPAFLEGNPPAIMYVYSGCSSETVGAVSTCGGDINLYDIDGNTIGSFNFWNLVPNRVTQYCYQAAQAKVMKAYCQDSTCCNSGGTVAIEIRIPFAGQQPQLDRVFTSTAACGSDSACADRIDDLVAQINASDVPVTASVDTDGALLLTADTAGSEFNAFSLAGMFPFTVVTENITAWGTGQDLLDLAVNGTPGKDIVTNGNDINATGNYKIVQFIVKDEVELVTSGHPAGSYGFEGNDRTIRYNKVWVAFENTSCAAELTAFCAFFSPASDAAVQKLLKRMCECGTCTNISFTYSYCVIRQDDGDGTALTTAQNDYDGTTGYISLVRTTKRTINSLNYSFYTYTGTIAPTAVGSDYVLTGGTCSQADIQWLNNTLNP